MERPKPQLGTQNETTGNRILAWGADTVLILLAGIAIGWLLKSEWIIIVTWVFGSLAYHIFFEATYGQTLGKRLTNIVVVKEDGSPCDWKAATIRNVLRVIDGLILYLVGMIVIIGSDDNQRIGDIAGTTVVTMVATEVDVQKEEWSGFVVKIHGEGSNRSIELVNETDMKVDLSGAKLLHDSEVQFRFQRTQAYHRPGHSMAELLDRNFDVEPETPLTLELTSGDNTGKRYEVRWN